MPTGLFKEAFVDQLCVQDATVGPTATAALAAATAALGTYPDPAYEANTTAIDSALPLGFELNFRLTITALVAAGGLEAEAQTHPRRTTQPYPRALNFAAATVFSTGGAFTTGGNKLTITTPGKYLITLRVDNKDFQLDAFDLFYREDGGPLKLLTAQRGPIINTLSAYQEHVYEQNPTATAVCATDLEIFLLKQGLFIIDPNILVQVAFLNDP